MKNAIIIAIAFVLLTPVGMSYAKPETLDFENCEGILTIDELKNAIKHMEDITVRTRGLTPVGEKTDLQTMCDSTFELHDKSISMTIVVMDSSDTANALYKENLDSFSGGDFDIREYVTFWNNFDVTVNDQNVGSFMISQYDKFFINFHTSFDKDNPSLVDADELRVLSTIVQKKILDLDDVSISPPNPLPLVDTNSIAYFPPPLKQISNGVAPENVTCTEGLVIVLKSSNNSPACVKPATATKLIERGWANIR